MPRSRPPSKRPRLPYALLAWLYHARQPWLARHGDGSLTASVGKTADALGTRQEGLHGALEYLLARGFVERVSWHGTYFVTKPAVPVGMHRDELQNPSPIEVNLDDVEVPIPELTNSSQTYEGSGSSP